MKRKVLLQLELTLCGITNPIIVLIAKNNVITSGFPIAHGILTREKEIIWVHQSFRVHDPTLGAKKCPKFGRAYQTT